MGAKPLGLGFRFGLIRASSSRPNRKPNPTFFQKADILFKAINRKNISCKRYSLSCSGLCQTYRCKQNAVFQSLCRVFHDCYSSKFFLFIALHLMQNPIGWCCDWLKITELAQGFTDRHSIECLARDILHQVQGGFSVFVLSVATGCDNSSLLWPEQNPEMLNLPLSKINIF